MLDSNNKKYNSWLLVETWLLVKVGPKSLEEENNNNKKIMIIYKI